MFSALFPAFVLAAIGLTAGYRFLARRRVSKMRLSGGRKALALYLSDRGP